MVPLRRWQAQNPVTPLDQRSMEIMELCGFRTLFAPIHVHCLELFSSDLTLGNRSDAGQSLARYRRVGWRQQMRNRRADRQRNILSTDRKSTDNRKWFRIDDVQTPRRNACRSKWNTTVCLCSFCAEGVHVQTKSSAQLCDQTACDRTYCARTACKHLGCSESCTIAYGIPSQLRPMGSQICATYIIFVDL